MRRTLLFTFLLSLSLFSSQAQKGSLDSEVLFSLGDTNYELGTFKYYFLKNTDEPSADSAQIKVDEYLELYIKFRLKVLEAKRRGMDQDPAFIEELAGYKTQLAEPYLTATQFNEALIQEAYDRSQQEVSVAHLLIKVDPNALPADTLKAYNRILDIKKEIEGGLVFEQAAKRYSEDPSARMNSGNLGYFSALQMVYPFENAVYEHEIGELVGPVKTQFGYHLLKVLDKRPARGQVKAAHIMLRTGSDSAAVAAKKKIDTIYDNLIGGADWKEQCRIYSEDKSSSNNGGELRWFGTGALVPEFENVAFALENPGDISEPVQTRFGWHIIKLIDKKPVPPLDELRSELETRVKRDSRSRESTAEVLKSLKKTQEFELDSAVLEAAFAGIDSTVKWAKWSYDTTDVAFDQVLFKMKGGSYQISDFYAFVLEEQRQRSRADLEDYKKQLYERFESESVLAAERAYLEQNNQDYQQILDEYESGILLFNLMEEEVWEKALLDSVGLKQFFAANQDKYQSEEALIVKRLVGQDSALLSNVGQQVPLSNSQMDSLINSSETLALQVDELKIKRGELEFLDAHWSVGSYYQRDGQSHVLWVVEEIEPATPLKLDDIRGLAISDYQKHLEEVWVQSLMEKYPYKLNKKVLKRFVKTFD